jgi:hypothetical protein
MHYAPPSIIQLPENLDVLMTVCETSISGVAAISCSQIS